MKITRRVFLRDSVKVAVGAGIATRLQSHSLAAAARNPRRLLLRSSWQTINIGDIAHTPGMLALLEKHLREAEVTLWPNQLSNSVETMLRRRFPKLRFAKTADEKETALHECDFCLHGSGPGLVGWRELEKWRATGKPYGFGGVTLSDAELKDRRELLAGAKFIFCRDTLSLDALKASGIAALRMEFGPDATFHLDLHDDAKAEAFLKKMRSSRGSLPVLFPACAGRRIGRKDANMPPRNSRAKKPRTKNITRPTTPNCARRSSRGCARRATKPCSVPK